MSLVDLWGTAAERIRAQLSEASSPERQLDLVESVLLARPSRARRHPVTIHLNVDDADAVIQRAVAAGAQLETEPMDQSYGERSGSICDPFGHG